jgi:hypothetical protein
MNYLAFELQQFMLTWNILNIKFYRTLEIENVFHKQMNGFNKIGGSMVKVVFTFMVHLKVLHCSSWALRLKMDEDEMFNFYS